MDARTILIVDDTPENISLIAAVLNDTYRTTVATHGRKALQIAQSDTPPDLILLDVMMPELSGYDVCQRLKADERTRAIPVIFLTAMSETVDEEKGFELGAVDYITKPIRPAILRARIKTHLELKEARDALEHMATTDKLTGVPNRRRFDDVAAMEWARASRGGTTLSIAMIDVDFFKKYNDAHGHGAGDACLASVATAMKGALGRKTDMLARYGGEEFSLLLPGLDEPGFRHVLENVLQRVAEMRLPHGASGVGAFVSVSVGAVCLRPREGESFADALAKADKLLYQAKSEGRDRCVFQVEGGPVSTFRGGVHDVAP